MVETNFDWDDLRLFLAIARSGGLGPASASTGKSPPTLGRRMLALERRLGLELFKRLPRGYELTEQGRDFLSKVTAIENKIAPLADAEKRPVVKISAGQWVTDLLCRKAAEIVESDPVLLRFIAADHVLDIGRREAVIGVRNRRPDQIGLAGRRIGRVQFAVYAVDNEVRTWARVIGATPSARWLDEKIGDEATIEVTNSRNALDLALAGVARAVLPTFVGNVQSGLEQVTAPIDILDHDQWLVTHDDDRFLPEVRRVIERTHAVLRTVIK
ncbi:LysR family transcriptional regulator [Agrobacterium pusense]|uniref:LysR family transcriptional regulator n=1 Tax=Agrobacterium pusense TaxID=648995 RepID=UPI00244892D6|nr:LysR family transcriptional regulator [Agrobacterium pusense]MDH0872737.1 LysR family transcriptional regulator [Agrobacterium pusense]